MTSVKRRRALGLCTRCGDPKPPSCSTRDCPACLRSARTGGISRADRKALRDQQIARIMAMPKTMSPEEQAALLGVKAERVHYLRCKARQLGYDVPRGIGGVPKGATTSRVESAKWRAIDLALACPRCGLRGEHECIPAIYELASSRRGPGRVMPEGGPGGMRAGEKG